MLRSRIPAIALAMPELLDQALEQGAERIVASAQERVPVATGDLKDAIHVDRQSEGIYVIAGDTEVFYGHIVENGSVTRGPRPFLVPALAENTATVLALAKTALKGLV
jgi:HK97 gp10 family phage protein